MPVYTQFSDLELLKLLQAGDEKAFTEIYNRYWEKLLAIGYYYTYNKQASEDIVHEVMMGLWCRRKELYIESLQAYLGVAVKFSVFKAIARKKRYKDLQTSLNEPEQYSEIEAKLDAKFLEEYLQGVVEQLPFKARLIFTYSRTQKLSIKEIAGKMN